MKESSEDKCGIEVEEAKVDDYDDEEEEEEDQKLTEQEKQVLVQALHRVLKPFILRRIKDDVATDLPDKAS
jgi:SNF2 family DNA or RNA helicase